MFRVLDYAWHQTHSYRLMHALDDCEFHFLKVGPRTWKDSLRPRPPNFKGFVQSYEPGQYNLAILHLDQWCTSDHALRGYPYRLVDRLVTDIPKVVIMHGTPESEDNRRQIVKLIGNNHVVCNSQTACQQWGLGAGQSRAIIHGYNVDEFMSDKTRRLQVATVCSGGKISRHYHGIPLLEQMRRHVAITWIGDRGDMPFFDSYWAYREFLSGLLIYFHPGQQSPMPGARTEAMLSGCCVVSTNNQDADQYIVHGETGFLSNDFVELRNILRELLQEPERAYRIGKAGRAVARQLFTREELRRQWHDLIIDIV